MPWSFWCQFSLGLLFCCLVELILTDYSPSCAERNTYQVYIEIIFYRVAMSTLYRTQLLLQIPIDKFPPSY